MDQIGANEGRPGPEAQAAAIDGFFRACRACDLAAAAVLGRRPEDPGHPADKPTRAASGVAG